MLPFEFTQPWLLILIVPMAFVLGTFYIRSLSDFPRVQRTVSLVTRGTLATCMVLALAGLTWLHQTDEQFVVFLVDQSQSIGLNARQATDDYLTQAARNCGPHQIAFLPFASSVGTVRQEPLLSSTPPSNSTSSSTTDAPTSVARIAAAKPEDRSPSFAEGTNLEEAIEAAAGYIPPGYVPQIVVLSDGNQTEGDATLAAAQSPVPVSTIPLPTRVEPEVQISAVKVPTEVLEGEPFYVDVTISSNHDDEGLIEVYRGDHKVVSEKRRLVTGENKLRFQQSVERDRMVAFKVRVSDLKSDTFLDNNSDSGLVYTSGRPKILIIESDPNLIKELAYALEDEDIHVDVRPTQGMPDSLAGLQNYELLILSNVPATQLTQQQMEITRTYVQELGGGLLMLGGEQSFGLGGYYKTILEEILPVRSDFEKEKEKPSLGMVLIIDRSGSMDGDKLEMAKTAARSAVELLGDRDQIAVIAFDDQTSVISEMQSANNKGRISDDIAGLQSGGGTSMYPAMEMSYQILSSTGVKLKHVIILTDGISNTGDFEALARQMAESKMTVSVVAIGDEGSTDTQLLESIARTGKGRYYLAEDPSQVPQIFAKETITASKSAIDEEPFVPQVLRATKALAEIDMKAAPFLLGYVTTRPKPTSEVILVTEKGDPLLAWWRYGLGMTAAFTSDAKSRWASEWITWPGYGKFWTQVVRQLMRKSETKGLRITTNRQGTRTEISVDAFTDSGGFLNESNVEMSVISPLLQTQKHSLRQIAPGRYQTNFETSIAGAYNIDISVGQGGEEVYRQSRGLMVGYSDELRIQPTNVAILKSIASLSGGQFHPDANSLFKQSSVRATRPTPLWPWLLTVAAILLILDVALRRIDFQVQFRFRPRGSDASAPR